MLKTNEAKIVEFLLQCQPGPPKTQGTWRVVHSNCLLAGHGPGVTTLMTCETPLIKPVIDPKANIADLLGIGTAAKV